MGFRGRGSEEYGTSSTGRAPPYDRSSVEESLEVCMLPFDLSRMESKLSPRNTRSTLLRTRFPLLLFWEGLRGKDGRKVTPTLVADGLLLRGSRGSRLCLNRFERLHGSRSDPGSPMLPNSDSRDAKRVIGVRGNWSGGAELNWGSTSFDVMEGDDEGREYTGLDGRKKDAEGRIPPAWVVLEPVLGIGGI
jgi:hypothetical protein